MKARVSVPLFAALLPALAVAQAPAPEDFGTQDDAITIIGYEEFFPNDSQFGYSTGIDSRRTNSSPGIGALLYAPLNMLPNGSLLVETKAYVVDNDNNPVELSVNVCGRWVETNAGGGPGGDCPITMHTSGAPGDATIGDPTDLPILYRQDVDGDGDVDVVNYFITSATPANTGMRMVRLRWRRQVSPEPANATFGDVPTNHQYFQWIEALSKSGITAGGLHWPWDAQ
jgi:hypothetical protein